MPINALLLQQFEMASLLKQLALTQNENDIRILHRSQSMSNHNHCATLSGSFKRSLDELLALGIERAGGLVKEQDLRVSNERAGNRDALLLASGKGDAPGADVCVVAFWEGDDEVVDGGVAAGLVDLFVGDGGFVDAEDDVVSESACDGDKVLSAGGGLLFNGTI